MIDIPQELLNPIPGLGSTEANGVADPTVWLRLYNSALNTSWYIIEKHQMEADIIFSSLRVGEEEIQVATFSRTDLEETARRAGAPTVCDTAFVPISISELMERLSAQYSDSEGGDD